MQYDKVYYHPIMQVNLLLYQLSIRINNITLIPASTHIRGETDHHSFRF